MANIVEQMTAEYNPVNRNAKLSTIMEKWSRTGLLKKLDDEKGQIKGLLDMPESQAIGALKNMFPNKTFSVPLSLKLNLP